jgi:hypothetical protein
MRVQNSIQTENMKAVSGICENLNEFSGVLRTADGRQFKAALAIGKKLSPENEMTVFRIFDKVDVSVLENQILTN